MITRQLQVMHNANGWGPSPIGDESIVAVSIGEYAVPTKPENSKEEVKECADTVKNSAGDEGYRKWLLDSPYISHRKSDRVDRMCDWLMSAERRNMMTTGSMSGQRIGGGMGAASQMQQGQIQQGQSVFEQDDDQSGFSIYDTSKLPRSSYPRRGGRFGAASGGRGGRYGMFTRPQMGAQAPLLGQLKPTKSLKNLERERERQIMKLRKQQGNRHDQKMQQQGRVRRLPTVQIRSDWTVVEEASFSQLTKLSMTVPCGTTVCEMGTIGYYDRAYDKLSTRLEKRLQMTHRPIADVTTIDDPVVREMCMPGNKYEGAMHRGQVDGVASSTSPGSSGDVFATDSILTTLMCSCRSVYPWDIKITKYNNKIFLDRRSNFDEITVR